MELLELYESSPGLFFVTLFISLVITLLGYCAIPLIFAATRKAPITRRRFRVLCFVFNLIVMIIFIAINGEPSSMGPYVLWTGVFSSAGIKILNKKGRLITSAKEGAAAVLSPPASENVSSAALDELSEINPVVEEISPEAEETTPVVAENTNDKYCTNCGFKLLSGSNFCSACGSPVKANKA